MSITAQAIAPISYGHPKPKLLMATLTPIGLILILQPLLPILLPESILAYLPDVPIPTFPALQANLGFSMLAFVGAVYVIPAVSEAFVEKGLKGRDLLKPGGRISGPWIPECMGLPCASLYILLMMLFIPFPFSHIFQPSKNHGLNDDIGRESFPQGELTLYLSCLLSLLTAVILGFLDDLFDIRWRHKIPIPLVAAIPTLVVYYSEGGLTSVVLPRAIGTWLKSFGFTGWSGPKVIDLGPLYYLYLLMLPTFTTNSINILAGINGVEITQAFTIALSIVLNDLLFLPIWPEWVLQTLNIGNPLQGRILPWAAGEVVKRHLMSLYFMTPMLGITTGFLWHNWYPARAFPGDTFCYFAGMAFSAVALQGHFTKTLILFFIPQIFNFILSCPQLFRIVPCPRHRLPAYDAETDLLHPSKTIFEIPPKGLTKLILEIFELLHLIRLERTTASPTAPPETSKRVTRNSAQSASVDAVTSEDTAPRITSSTNFTILNTLLVIFGPMKERTLCMLLGGVQIACSMLAFWIRYGLGAWLYGGDRR